MHQLFQLSVADRRLPFCNQRKLIVDTTNEFEINRYRPDGDSLTEVEKEQLEILENEQVSIFFYKKNCSFIYRR